METADRRSAADGHILIGGTGRAGTTLLVQYFTALGFDTGYTLEHALGRVDPISKAGLEHPVRRVLRQGKQMPYVAKSPSFGKNLVPFMNRGEIKIKHCIIPMREISAAAESRRHVNQQALETGKTIKDKQPGGLIAKRKGGAEDGGRDQELHLAMQFHQFLYTMVDNEVPVHFLRFPAFARGEQDIFAALEPIMVEHGVTKEESDQAFTTVAKPDLIHEFKSRK